MRSRHGIAGILLLVSCTFATALGAPPPKAQSEINELLQAVSSSGCAFYRNGTWYDAKRAEAHLRYKYEQLVARNLVASAEEFIDRAATGSSVSGKPYLIRCPRHDAVPSATWLKQALARERAEPPTK